ncbi:MAG TPA: carbohydrate ABC transporter permease [Erysipelotrichaceae bacterium]|nr:carbohydrate ABC transporter permease [Erysipelotrichaceae bacterium]HBZ41069.1 carbohydrate ABC transporter permease [Erysipelotrichaceae bacterium]
MKLKLERPKVNTSKLKRKLLGYNISDGLVYRIAVYILLVAIAYVFLYPLLRMISMTFMSSADIINPEIDWVPQNWSITNLRVAWSVLSMPNTILNSLWYSGTLALAQTFISAMTGFAFARYQFKFKNFWFAMVLMSFIIPVPVVLIPRWMMFITAQNMTGIKMIGTVFPQLLMAIAGQGVYSAILILIFFNFFKMIPVVLDEAAKIDGASSWQVFYHIILKMSVPTIATVFLFSFVWNYNESYITATFLRSALKLMPLQLGLFDSIFEKMSANVPGASGAPGGQFRINESFKMAATLITMAPMMIMYLFVQKQFVEGIEKTGITGE